MALVTFLCGDVRVCRKTDRSGTFFGVSLCGTLFYLGDVILMNKEKLLSSYILYSRIIADSEIDILEAKEYRKEYEDKLIEQKVTEEELQKIYEKVYEEEKVFKEKIKNHLDRKGKDGEGFRFDKNSLMSLVEDIRKSEK